MSELLPFQFEDSAWLRSKRHALLAHEMGVGKTPIAIDACKNLKNILIVCPSVAKYNWQNEFLKFNGRPSHVAENGIFHEDKNVVIASFNYVTAYKERFKKRTWDALIIDEAHYLKEPAAGRTQALLGGSGLLHNANFVWALSGTPAPNHAGELWTFLYTFGATTISYQGFISRYCKVRLTSGAYSRVEITGTRTEHAGELRSLIKKIAKRRFKKDVHDLPSKTHETFYIKGDDDSKVFRHNVALKGLIKEEFALLKERLNIEVANIDDDKLLSVLQFLAPSLSSLRRYHGIKKVHEVAKLVSEELSQNQYKKIIIFGVHTIVLELLEKELKRFNPVLVNGKINAKEKYKRATKFCQDESCRVFLGNIKACGVAINLTSANQVLFIEEDWVPGNNAQAIDRAHRYGQSESVTVRHVAIKDSIDAKLTETLIRKTKELSTFLD